MAEVHDRLREFWDRDSEVYDRSISHAIADPAEAAAWRAALARHLPAPGASLLDVGAGTGSISLLAAEMGYRVTALDLSPGMLDRGRAKAGERGLDVQFVVGRALLRIPPHHHAEYDPRLRSSLPLAGTSSPVPFVRAVAAAGWRRIRVERLRDVEWARRMAAPPLLGWLEAVPQFAVLAEA